MTVKAGMTVRVMTVGSGWMLAYKDSVHRLCVLVDDLVGYDWQMIKYSNRMWHVWAYSGVVIDINLLCDA